MTKNFLIVLAVIYPMTYNFMGYEMTIVKAIQASTVLIMAMMIVLNEEKKMIFLDRQCPTCNGSGCDQCHGTGMIGSVDCAHVPTPQPKPNSFSVRMRAWRLAHGRTFRELSADTGILPSILSEIENGRRVPTEKMRQRIEEVMR